MFHDDMSLQEIEELLEKLLLEDDNFSEKIRDMNLSLNDYRHLVHKLEGLSRLNAKMIVLRKYRLSVLMAWFYRARNKGIIVENEDMISLINDLPQYEVRYLVQLCKDTLEEYGINGYGIDQYMREELYRRSSH